MASKRFLTLQIPKSGVNPISITCPGFISFSVTPRRPCIDKRHARPHLCCRWSRQTARGSGRRPFPFAASNAASNSRQTARPSSQLAACSKTYRTYGYFRHYQATHDEVGDAPDHVAVPVGTCVVRRPVDDHAHGDPFSCRRRARTQTVQFDLTAVRNVCVEGGECHFGLSKSNGTDQLTIRGTHLTRMPKAGSKTPGPAVVDFSTLSAALFAIDCNCCRTAS